MSGLNRYILSIVVAAFVSAGCSSEDSSKSNSISQNLEVQDFVWLGLNTYYLWQAEVPKLADDAFGSRTEYQDFLSNYPNPEDLFDALRVDSSKDRFSWIVSDYTELEEMLNGTTKSDGVDFGLYLKAEGSTEVFGWVRYIVPNSDAVNKNIRRGDLFYAVNGTQLTTSNYQNLLFGSDTNTLNMADYDNGKITPNGKTVTLTKTELTENPILIRKVIDSGNSKIGYLMYNGFYSNFDNDLNYAFGYFKGYGVTDLVLDLRYNSGGSILSATRLASMITGQFAGQLFAREKWNDKIQKYLDSEHPGTTDNNFLSTMNGVAINSLRLTKVYILTTKSTASASELIINGLKPYIDVIQIGATTTGKSVGSITLYDSEDFSKDNVNPNHKYAMQPITLKIVNKDGYGDYYTGIVPTILQKENLANLDELGNKSEPLLSIAISKITGAARRQTTETPISFEHLGDIKSIRGQDRMYVKDLPR